MSSPILRRHDGEEEEESRHRKTFENEVITALSWFPTGLPSNGYSKIESDYKPGMSGPSMHRPESAPTSLLTSTRPNPEYVKSTTASPTLLPSTEQPLPSITVPGDDGFGGEGNASGDESDGSSHRIMPVVAGVGGVVIMAIIGFIVFFCLRKRKRQRQVLASQIRAREMKARSQTSMLPRMGTSPIYSQYAAPPSQPLSAAVASPPPVILGPIVPGNNGAYYTGIDTSDVVSMHDRPGPDRTGLGNPFADGDSLNEEPPPPYRPRSLAPMSRNTSLRAPPSFTSSQTHLIGSHDQSLRSPFADPADDDTISDISGPTRRNYDGLSVVSDMSYQEEPVVTRQAV